jgi:hypothetical protein
LFRIELDYNRIENASYLDGDPYSDNPKSTLSSQQEFAQKNISNITINANNNINGRAYSSYQSLVILHHPRYLHQHRHLHRRLHQNTISLSTISTSIFANPPPHQSTSVISLPSASTTSASHQQPQIMSTFEQEGKSFKAVRYRQPHRQLIQFGSMGVMVCYIKTTATNTSSSTPEHAKTTVRQSWIHLLKGYIDRAVCRRPGRVA